MTTVHDAQSKDGSRRLSMRPRDTPFAWFALAFTFTFAPCRADPVPPPPDWVHDALVLANPAAAVGGACAGVYTPSVNGIQPWRNAAIRWLTGRHVMGNTAVLVRQEARNGGAGLSAVVDPDAPHEFAVSAFVSEGRSFGDRHEGTLQLEAAVLDADDRVIAAAPIDLTPGNWSTCRVPFHSGRRREVRCVVRAPAPDALPCFYYTEGYSLTRTDHQWWTPQNLFDAPRTALRLEDARERLLATMDPDVVAGHNGVYLNWDGALTRRGVAVGGGHWEQEYNHLSIDDPLVDRFRTAGMACEIDGRIVQKAGLWPGYNMCHNAAAWHLHQRARMVRIAPDVCVVSQDNICAPSFEQAGKGCFCPGCKDGFGAWARARWDAARFRAAGIVDPTRFDIADYVRDVAGTRIAKGRDAVLADPLLREFIRFQYASQLGQWRDSVRAACRAAGRPIVVCGNQWGAGGQRPYSVALSRIGHAAVVETGGAPFTPRNRAWDALAVKLPMAAGEYRRPVWLYMTSLFHAPVAGRTRLRLSTAQGWADGGVPNPWATAPGASGWFYDGEAAMCRFVQRHRALFARRERIANVGLVYSLPTLAWRQFRAFNLSPEPERRWFAAWAHLLEEARVPYEINCWSHPLLGDDHTSIARIERYDVLILPGVDCFSNEQRAALRAFQARGGRVIAVGGRTWHDADAVPRSPGETLAGPGARLIEVDPDTLSTVASAGERPTPEKIAVAQAASATLRTALDRALGPDRLLETDAPATVWANLWLDDTRRVLTLHLVNGDIDLAADRFRPVPNSRWRVRLPPGLTVSRAAVISPDKPTKSGEVQPVPVEIDAGWASIVLPRFDAYAVVALFDGKALDAASDLASARRAFRRAALIRGGEDTTDGQRLAETLAQLRVGPGDGGAVAARRLAEESAAALAEALRRAAPEPVAP